MDYNYNCYSFLMEWPFYHYKASTFNFCCSVVKSCLTVWDSMDCMQHPRPPCPSPSPRVAQTHVHWVGEAIQPSHPLTSPSPPAFTISQHQGLSSELALSIRWPKCWSFSFSISPSNEYSELISFRLTGLISLQFKGLSRVFSSTICKHQFFGIFFMVQLSLPYMTTGKKKT